VEGRLKVYRVQLDQKRKSVPTRKKVKAKQRSQAEFQRQMEQKRKKSKTHPQYYKLHAADLLE